MLIIPDRIEKSRSKKTRERSSLQEYIALNGRTADMPCSYCFKNKKKNCKIAERSSRCEECVSRGQSCDGLLVASSLEKVLAQQRKLDNDEEEASEKLLSLHSELARLQSQLAEAAGSLSRIRKIRRKVKERGADLFERGMQELDAEDEILPALDGHEGCLVDDL